MASQVTGCRVHFPPEYDERGEWEAEGKGYLQGVRVELPDGSVYPLYAYDPVRLAEDLESDVKWGRGAVAEPGLVVVPEVTRATIVKVAEQLARAGYFGHLKPLTADVANGVLH